MHEGAATLIEGSRINCPRCLVPHDVLAHRQLRMAPSFQEQLNPILRCPDCGWLFAPGVGAEALLEPA